MSYKDKPQIRLYKYENNSFTLKAIIDDCKDLSFEHNLYSAGQFTITINYNIPNALLFERGLFVQFGNNPYDFGEIYSIQDAIGQNGKSSQIRTITGYDARYILKRRVIKNMNSNGLWTMTAKGELCLRNLIKDQCGAGAEAKRQLPINNVIPSTESAIGKEYSVSEQFSNLYEVCKTIATQSEIGWRIAFDGELTLEVYEGQNLSEIVKFDTDYESLANGDFSDSSESFTNAIYIGGKGQNDDRDIYEGEDGSPNGLDRFESWDNQSSMTTESEYETEALSMLSQYGQTLTMQGNGLAKCPYIFREQYDIGDIITVAFSGKSAVAQILSVTEHWAWGSYDIQFSFGKPQNNLAEQLQLMLRQIQKASEKASSTDSVRWYTIPTDTTMPKADVTYNTIGFVGTVGTNATFTLYLDNEKTGAKTYHVWFKQLGGTGKLTLTTGKSGAVNLTMGVGTYVAIISVDEAGNIVNVAETPTDLIQSGNNAPLTSNAVATSNAMPVNSVTSGNMHSVTSGAVAGEFQNLKNGIVMETLDLNSYIECGLYVTKNNEIYTNVPESIDGRFFSLLVVATAEYLPPLTPDYFRNQILYKYHQNEIYTRTYSYSSEAQGLVWSAWRKVAFIDNLGISESEQKIGTWIDGKPLYKKAIVFNIPQNGRYNIPINVSGTFHVVKWSGNFFQEGYTTPAFIMHIPYTFIDKDNPNNIINIYCYFAPEYNGFMIDLYGLGQYAGGYFNGQAVLYVEYTKG